MPNISGVMDDAASVEDRAKDLLKILEFLAEQTETTIDDKILDKVQILAEQPEFWLTLQKVYLLFSDDDSDVETKIGALQEDRDMDPATIMLIVEVIGLVVRLWRERRD